jgi:hypothetical protein
MRNGSEGRGSEGHSTKCLRRLMEVAAHRRKDAGIFVSICELGIIEVKFTTRQREELLLYQGRAVNIYLNFRYTIILHKTISHIIAYNVLLQMILCLILEYMIRLCVRLQSDVQYQYCVLLSWFNIF